jgi:hypothetical protein
MVGESAHRELLEDIRGILGAKPGLDPAEDQPLYLGPHSRPTDLAHGVPLGATAPPLKSPGIWPLKSELKGADFMHQDLDEPVGRSNYSSVNDFASQVRATFMEEVHLGMVEGPVTKQQAAARCQCLPEDLCPGPLAAIDEGDKNVRNIYDGSVGGANHHIQNQTLERTTAPTVLHCVRALHWLQEARGSQPTSASGLEGWDQHTTLWQWPQDRQQWILLKADVAKAHRRVKILPQDWRHQMAELQGEWWVNKFNKVCTYGKCTAVLG